MNSFHLFALKMSVITRVSVGVTGMNDHFNWHSQAILFPCGDSIAILMKPPVEPVHENAEISYYI
jgi:hypothetical protein